ncbi:MAG: tetratricopeptide repeat-containing sensor histidine kinase [Bacteroidales bacterium]|nr:tetratricopeptide repeat-containing sensor histidine kinase [Bacteroidales bacterium]
MLSRGLHIAVFIFLAMTARSQGNITDTVLQTLPEMHDSVKMEVLKKYALDEQYRSLRSGLIYAGRRMEIAKKLNDAEKIAETWHIYGNLYTSSGLLPEAEENYLKALTLFDSLKLFEDKASILHNLGLVAFKRNDTLKSIEAYKTSIDLRKEALDERRIGDELTTLGETYLAFKDYDNSRKYLLEALEYYRGVEEYGRKMDAWAFLIDNYYESGQRGARSWIDSMILENNKMRSEAHKNMIKLRLCKYHLKNNELELSAAYIDSINFELLHNYEVIDPLDVISTLAEKYRNQGNESQALTYRLLYRQHRSYHTRTEVQNLVSNYNIRLSIKASEENIEWSQQQNELIVKRIKLEKIISFIINLALFLTIAVLAYLLYNLNAIRKTNIKLEQRRAGLQEAYERSSRYKERILSIRENKSDFFSIISLKLSKPFSNLTAKLSDISEYLGTHSKDLKLKTQMEQLYKDSSGIEKGLERILLWSKLQRNKYMIEQVTFNLNDFLHEILPALLGIALKKDIRIRFDVDPGIEIKYDRFCLRTILTILTENSIEHSHPRSDIIIRAEKSKSGCTLSVTDFGSGIPESLKDKIFDLSRVKNESTTTDTHKMGLGLLIVKLMTKKNHSLLSLESKKNSGTTIFIHINNTHD